MLIILFGLPGVGKNYIGEIFKKEYKFIFFDADKAMTLKVKKKIKDEKIITDKEREECYKIVFKKIAILSKKNKNIVVGQALFKNKHRRLLLEKFSNAIFILVKANKKTRKLRTIVRSHHVTPKYAEKVEYLFEKPNIKHYILINNKLGNKKIIKKIKKIIQKQKY